MAPRPQKERNHCPADAPWHQDHKEKKSTAQPTTHGTKTTKRKKALPNRRPMARSEMHTYAGVADSRCIRVADSRIDDVRTYVRIWRRWRGWRRGRRRIDYNDETALFISCCLRLVRQQYAGRPTAPIFAVWLIALKASERQVVQNPVQTLVKRSRQIVGCTSSP